jgi:hypothetical protein
MENIEFNIALEEIDDHFTEKLNDNLNKIREQLHSSHENTTNPWIISCSDLKYLWCLVCFHAGDMSR